MEDIKAILQAIRDVSVEVSGLGKEFAEFRGRTDAMLDQITTNITRRLDSHAGDIDEIKEDITDLREESVAIKTQHESELKTAKVFGMIGLGILALIEVAVIVFTVIKTGGGG